MNKFFSKTTLPKTTLIFLVLLVSLLFVRMISQFLMAIFMAGLISAMAYPFHSALSKRFKGRKNISAAITIFALILLLLIPLSILVTMVISQAVAIGQNVKPWVQTFIDQPTVIDDYLQKVPFYEVINPYRDVILQKAGNLVGTISTFFIDSLSSFTKLTIDAIFSTFLMLYVMFYFLNMGQVFLEKILYLLPLDDISERRLLYRFTSVTKATLKGVVVIGIMQGTICGAAFAITGIQGPVFWGTVMAVSSIIPAFGTALIWVPALLIMLLNGQFINALILAVICGAIAGNLDNFVRPRLIGKDTQMHDLFVLFGTLGGISMFGILGIIIGPIITALFITLWEIYGDTFRDYLPSAEVVLQKDEALESPQVDNKSEE